ncbi:hypothetical protein [Streptomyces triticiradicis]|uniref:Uncharacterized protein n=1 Tax=Streptomyces triticiradicis TaxID=2651189 RepID=A0A7J5D2Q8_9ACTN|nr:hypothetical protein [Streptomyces triticiradicis]KAB1977854.1 hypothetical protein F8144_40885 [Streptomyces triticiradicis]
MTTDKRRNKRRGREQNPETASVGTTRPATVPGPRRELENSSFARLVLGSRDACARLLRWKKAETDNGIRRRRAHVDDVLRVIRNLVATVVFFSAVSVLVAYAGIRMGVAPEIAWVGTVTGGPMLIRTFIKLFESVRSALPDAPKDPPSSDVP